MIPIHGLEFVPAIVGVVVGVGVGVNVVMSF
jgi:hypothetical protein